MTMRPFEPTVYLLASHYRGRLYTGVTSDLMARIYRHRDETYSGYTTDKDIKRLVWFERHDEMTEAIRREKAIKRWVRQWKFNVIEAGNPGWRDLAEDFGFPSLG
jgi:putative endonuclease